MTRPGIDIYILEGGWCPHWLRDLAHVKGINRKIYEDNSLVYKLIVFKKFYKLQNSSICSN